MEYSGANQFKLVLSAEQIANRVKELGREISKQYQGLDEPLVLVGILKGSFIFLADLCRAIDVPVEIEFMGLSSYGEATQSSGVVQITQDLTRPIKGRHVLLVEDLVETGLTAKYLLENFATRQPASLKLCTFVEKPSKNKGQIKIDFLGFQIPPDFVVGYGFDVAQVHRNLPYLGALEQNS